ncbi:MAG: HD domain-containing protein [Bacillota bacterium]
MESGQRQTFAVMHLSSELAVFYLVEYTCLEDIIVLEEARREITFGVEAFQNGFISFETVRDVCELLQGFKQIMREYDCVNYRLVATTAMREAQNKAYIVDQIKIKTGLQLEVLDISVENYYIYTALFREALDNKFVYNRIADSNAPGGVKNILFADVSSGGMSVALYAENELQYQHNINISAMRIRENFTRAQRENIDFPQALEELVAASVENIVSDLQHEMIQSVVFAGAEVPLLLKMLRHQLRSGYVVIDRLEFLELYKSIRFLGAVQLTKRFGLIEDEAEYILPMMTIYRDVLQMTAAQEIIVTRTGFIQGLAVEAVVKRVNSSWAEVIEKHIYQLACAYAEKYHYDVKHAIAIEQYAMKIFDSMSAVHGMGQRERFLLQIACVFHDIGKHIGLRRHYLNSFHLVKSYDLLGFSDAERGIIAYVAYFHSSDPPDIDSPDMREFSEIQRMTISKLAAIIRIADALDRSHLQKILSIDVVIAGEELQITMKYRGNTALEEWMFEEKAEFFEEVYGIIPILLKGV